MAPLYLGDTRVHLAGVVRAYLGAERVWAAAAPSVITGAEVGGITATTAELVYDVPTAATARAVMSTSPDLSSPIYGTTSTGTTGKSRVTGLPDGRVYWAVEVDGSLSAHRGSFRTAPAGPASFKVVVASCAGGGTSPYITAANSNAPTFEAMRAVGADLWLHPGDRHYKDPGAVSVAQHVAFQAESRAVPRQRELLSTLGLIYHPDDHELSNNWTGATAGAANLLAAIDTGTAHYPYAVAGTWAHTGTWGRVRFVSLDTRSKRVTGDMLGAEQRAWLDNLLRTCAEPVVVLDTNVAFIGDGSGSDAGDGWGAYPASQRAVAESITAARARGVEVLIVAGDAHMLAMDDGTNSQYDPAATGKGARVCQFGPLDSGPSVKGGPYSLGTSTASRYQFGVLDITDTNDVVTIVATGYRVSETAPYPTTAVMTQTLVADGTPVVAPPPPVATNSGTVLYQGFGETPATTATSVSATLPQAPVPGRQLVTALAVDKSVTNPVPPAGFVLTPGNPGYWPGTAGVGLVLATKVADGSETGPLTWTYGAGRGAVSWVAELDWKGAAPRTPTTVVGTESNVATLSGASPTGATGDLLISVAGVDSGYARTTFPWSPDGPVWAGDGTQVTTGRFWSEAIDPTGATAVGWRTAIAAGTAAQAVSFTTSGTDQQALLVARVPVSTPA